MAKVISHPLLDDDVLVKIELAERDYLSPYFKPMPNRETIVAMIHDGTFDGVQIGPGKNWFIWESTLLNFINALAARRQQKLAA